MKIQTNPITTLGVHRPVLITVLNLLILLAGIAAYLGVDVRELPNVDRPIVSVRAVYEGASPHTMDTEVTSVLEGAVSRVSGVRRIQSSSEENNMRLRAEFDPGYDLNVAASDVREAVSRIQRELPDEIDEVLVIKADDDAQAIMQLSSYSNVLDKQQLALRIEKDVVPELLSIDGIADVRLNGDQPRVLRILIDPAKLASQRLAMPAIIETLRNVRFDVPAGSYKSEGQELIVRAHATVVDVEKIKNIHISNTLRISDVAEVFYAPMEAESYSLLNGRMVIGIGIIRQAGSNTIEISEAVNKRIRIINERANDFTVVVTADDAEYITGALTEVIYTLCISGIIVLLVIAVFLGQWKTTLIPAVTMPISLIGTLSAIWLFGFSINFLTLLALVLATGLIVDDAIIVLENIQRFRNNGHAKMAAAVLGTQQVFFAVIATTITLISVFLPIAFLPGETGRLFREFGLVLAIAVSISSFVAVTLCPMMASRLSYQSTTSPRIQYIAARFNSLGRQFTQQYIASLRIALAHPMMMILIALAIALSGAVGFYSLQKELLPLEDRGTLRIALTGPDGASLAYSDNQARKIEAILKPYQDDGVITDIYSIIGSWDKNRASISANLTDWSTRNISQMTLAKEINEQVSTLPGSQVRISQRSNLGTRSTGGGLEIAILGTSYDDLADAADQLASELRHSIPEIKDIRIQFDTSQPEISFDIDREKANDLNVSMNNIAQTLRVMVDRYNIMDLNVDDQAVPIMLGPARGKIDSASDLANIFVTNNNSQLIPLSALTSVREQGVAAELDRHAQRRAIELDLGVEPGIALGEMMSKVRTVANETLPRGTSLIFLGEAAMLADANYDVAITFIIAFIVVFLVLAAQFESIGSAFIVIFTVPFGLSAAVFALLATGQSLNLYSQIGLIMLIGLMTKNAILLVEFMDQRRDAGDSVQDAIINAVTVRLRPVMMTVLSTVLGSLPLILNQGPGAEARSAIGWVVFGGLGISTLFTFYLAPLGYALIAPHLKPRAHAGKILEEQLKQSKQEEQI